MSVKHLDEAYSLVKKTGKKVYEMGIISTDEIENFSSMFDFALPASYTEFLKRYGSLSALGLEFYGLFPDDLYAEEIPNSYWVTKDLRENNSLPESLVVVEDLGDGTYACLALSESKNGEAPVVEWDMGQPSYAIDKLEVLSTSFGSYVHKRFSELVSEA
jgi:hypothetical protein